jgi:hypothetical protein
MTRTTIFARPDQIAELTRGLALPFDPLLQFHLTIIVEVLVQAWKELSIDHKVTIANGSEAEINALMTARLNGLLDDNQMWRQLVRCVTRGAESISFDGSNLEKRPDLSIQLTKRNPAFPLIVECKIIDFKSNKTTRLYCEQGLRRYIDGDYAWASAEAFMLAYVRDASSIKSSLTPFLIASEKLIPPPYMVVTPPEPVPHATADVARSCHNRNFTYTTNPSHKHPGPISIRHLWMACPPPEGA